MNVMEIREVVEYTAHWIKNIFINIYTFFSGVMASIFGYFLPIKDIVNLMLLFFLADVIFGYWAAKKLRNEKFSAKIIWKTTVPRMLISLVLIIGAFMWDDVFKQDFLSTYRIIGWFISGVLLSSIAQNGYHITNWEMFPSMAKYINKKLGEKTGIESNKENDGTKK